MQAEALVKNPCFYKGFFSTTGNLRMGNIFCTPFIQNHGFEYTKNYFSGLINFGIGDFMT